MPYAWESAPAVNKPAATSGWQSAPAIEEREATPEEIAEYQKRFEGSYENPGAGKRNLGGEKNMFSTYAPAAEGVLFGGSGELGAGLAAVPNAIQNAITGEGPQGVKENFQQSLALMNADRDRFQEEHPVLDVANQITGMAVPTLLTGGAAAAPAATRVAAAAPSTLRTIGTVAGRAAKPIAVGATGNTAYGVLSRDGSLQDRLNPEDMLHDAELGAGFGALVPAGRMIFKGGKWVIQKLAPTAASAEKDFITAAARDRIAHEKQAAIDAAKGDVPAKRNYLTMEDVNDARRAGQRPMVSDLGGAETRQLLDTAATQSPEARTELLTAAQSRQERQAEGASKTVSKMFGDAELNPKAVLDDLHAKAKTQNTKNYDIAMDHPNAQDVWDGELRSLTGGREVQRAMREVSEASPSEATRRGQPVMKPVFKRAQDHLMDFDGVVDNNGQLIPDAGVRLSFWDEVKKNLQGQADKAFKSGDRNLSTRITSIKNQLVSSLDRRVPEYKTARSDAKEFFDSEDAHEMGMKAFQNMDAMGAAEMEAAHKSLNPAEKELFARGWAAQYVHKIANLPDTASITSILKNPEQRRKMWAALGPERAKKLENYTHAAKVGRFLRDTVSGNSSTVLRATQAQAMNIGVGGVGGVEGYHEGGVWGIVPGVISGLLIKKGYGRVRKAVLSRYTKALSELARSEDEATFNRISQAIAADPEYAKFTNTLSESPEFNPRDTFPGRGGDQRREPRLFAAGGLVKMASGGGVRRAINLLEDEIAHVTSNLPRGRVDISDMPRLFNKADLEAVPDVEQRAVQRYNPPRGASERVQRMVGSAKVRRGVSEAMERGAAAGAKKWYNVEPLRAAFVSQLGDDEGSAAFRNLMDYVAASSPRSSVPENARNATFYYKQARSPEGLPEVGSQNPTPYGSLAQKLHQMNARRVATEGWDAIRNPKPTSFAQNLSGNQQPVTVDAHATKLAGILSRDPEWLASSVGVAKGIQRYPRNEYANFEKSMDEAVQDPQMWTGKPNKNEYASIEQMYSDLAREQGMTPAQGQASAWVGGAKTTGGPDKAADPFVKIFEDRILITSKLTGIPPEEVLKRVISGHMSLMRDGGRVRRQY